MTVNYGSSCFCFLRARTTEVHKTSFSDAILISTEFYHPHSRIDGLRHFSSLNTTVIYYRLNTGHAYSTHRVSSKLAEKIMKMWINSGTSGEQYTPLKSNIGLYRDFPGGHNHIRCGGAVCTGARGHPPGGRELTPYWFLPSSLKIPPSSLTENSPLLPQPLTATPPVCTKSEGYIMTWHWGARLTEYPWTLGDIVCRQGG